MEVLQIQIYETIRLGEEKIEAPHTSFSVLGRFLCAFKVPFRLVNSLPRPPTFKDTYLALLNETDSFLASVFMLNT